MRRDVVPRARRVGVLLVVPVLLAAGCTADPAPSEPSPTATATPTVDAALGFEAAVAALASDLVPAADVRPCDELGPGSPQPQEGLDPERDVAAAPGDLPAASACGDDTVEALRTASITGFAHGPGDDVTLPVTGGAARVVEVYELADAEAAAATYAARVADPDGWATDQEIPAEELDGGYYQPRRVVSGARLAAVEVPGWSATVLTRDEAGFTRDGAPSSQPVSYAYLWAVRDALLVRVQVAGDEPGAAATTAASTARAFATAVGPAGAGG